MQHRSNRLVLGISMLGALIFAQSVRAQTRQQYPGRTLFEKELGLARKSGLPLGFTDVVKSAPPPEQNAATYYGALLKRRVPIEEWSAIEILYTKVSPSPSEIGNARRLMAMHSEELALVHRAVECDTCVFPRKVSEWPMDMPPFAAMRSAARWLSVESAIQWHSGKRLEAIHTQALAFRIARHASQDRSLISYLVALAIESITLGGMRLALVREGQQPEVAREVKEALEMNSERPSLKYAMEGEIAATLTMLGIDPYAPEEAYFRRAWSYGPLNSSRPYAKLSASERKTWDHILMSGAYEIRGYRMISQLMDLPYPAARASTQDVVRSLKSSQRITGNNITDVVGQTWIDSLRVRAHNIALFEVARIGAAVLERRSSDGKLPVSLESVTTMTSLDPFDRKPLRYRLENAGFVVFSVGESGKFDGGTDDVKPKPSESVFRWPKPDWAR